MTVINWEHLTMAALTGVEARIKEELTLFQMTGDSLRNYDEAPNMAEQVVAKLLGHY